MNLVGDSVVRLRFDLRYDGSFFHGWAAQDDLRTVEGELADALGVILREPVRLVVAGRTDSGVHAANQVAHVDVRSGAIFPVLGLELPKQADLVGDVSAGSALVEGETDPFDFAKFIDQKSLDRFQDRINRLLAKSYSSMLRSRFAEGGVPLAFTQKGLCDVVVNRISIVSNSFDARFSAMARHYRYLIVDDSKSFSPVSRTDQWWSPYGGLQAGEMSKAALVLLGTHDFLSFCKPREGATTIRELRRLDVSRIGDLGNQRVSVDVSADAFCHSMVRALVGALVEVGRGKRDVAWVRSLVDNPSRSHGVPIAPARGLTLVRVDYPAEEAWGIRAAESRRMRDTSEICCGEGD